MTSTLGMWRAKWSEMRAALRNWPSLTQCLAGIAVLAGCHGMEPLQVNVQDPLTRNERDVILAGRGCSGFDGCDVGSGGRGSRSSGIDEGPVGGARSANPTVPTAGRVSVRDAGTAGSGGSAVAGGPPSAPSRPSSTPSRGGADEGVCGNGILEPSESCEKTDLNGFTCGSFGYPSGLLTCDPWTCLFDLSMCRRQPQAGAAGSNPATPVDAGPAFDASVADAAAPDATVGPDDDDAGVPQG